jgi:phage terminase large subunit GpA-like protein
VLQLYSRGDQRIFEIKCINCREYTELLWQHIIWEDNNPETAKFLCPHCGNLINETHKAAMVEAGRWRATRPEIKNHAGFRINALVSPMKNAAWPILVAEFLHVKDKPDSLKVFINTLLGQSWDSVQGNEFNEDILQLRSENFSLVAISKEVLSLTCGVDVQDDRFELTICGWSRVNDCYVLEHKILFGHINSDPELLIELDDILTATYSHPGGGKLKIDACIIDCADGGTHQAVMKFTGPRTHRKVLAGRGAPGFQRQPLARNTGRTKLKSGRNFYLVGVDSLKATIFDKLAKGTTIRFSDTLNDEYYFQLCSEKRVVRLSRGRAVSRFETIAGRRNECLDTLVYNFAAHSILNINLDDRQYSLTTNKMPIQSKPSPVIRSQFMGQGRI